MSAVREPSSLDGVGRRFWKDISVAELFLLLALVVALVPFVRYGWRVITYTYPVDYGEGPLLDQVRRLAALKSIYRADLSSPPFNVANYPPLFPLTQVPFYLVFGPAFWYGRAIAWFATVAASVFLGLGVHAITEDGIAGAVSGLLLLAIPYVLTWAPLCRVDTVALALSWAALFVIIRWSDRRGGLLGGAILLTAAVYTRQSYGLAAPFAAFVWVLHRRPRRRAFVLVGLVAGLGGTLFLLLNAATRGGFFYHIVTANVNLFQITTLFHYAGDVVARLPLLLTLGALFLILGGWPMRVESWWLAAPYLLGATATAVTIGKIGSNVNYLLELAAALSLTAGCLLAWLRARKRDHLAWRLVSFVLPLLLIAQVYTMVGIEGTYAGYVLRRTGETLENEVILNFIQETDGPVLTGEQMGLLALEGRPIVHQPFEMRQLARSGAWDQTPMLEALEDRAFPLVLLFRPPGNDVHERRWTPEMLDLIQSNYRVELNVSHTLIYKPRE